MKRRGNIYILIKTTVLPDILNWTFSLAWAVTETGEQIRRVIATLSILDSFMLQCFRRPPGSIWVTEVSGGLSPSSVGERFTLFDNSLIISHFISFDKCKSSWPGWDPPMAPVRCVHQSPSLWSQVWAPTCSDGTGRTCPPGPHITQQTRKLSPCSHSTSDVRKSLVVSLLRLHYRHPTVSHLSRSLTLYLCDVWCVMCDVWCVMVPGWPSAQNWALMRQQWPGWAGPLWSSTWRPEHQPAMPGRPLLIPSISSPPGTHNIPPLHSG